ncbi:MAG: aspartate kinase [Synergistaceae bacterium]|nr:aspartate kinase [Synergistaceae bacterium]
MSNLIVSRFGGHAAASAEEVIKAAQIIKANPDRRYIVVSAPGATPDSVGITDMLYFCHSSFHNGENYIDTLMKIDERYREIVDGLKIDFSLDAEIASLKDALEQRMNLDYIGSRGEYIMAKILAKYLEWEFVDASQLIFFTGTGSPDKDKTFRTANERLQGFERAVIPSFYGSLPDGRIKTFMRGDCDTAGAMVACAVKADLFEKWSDDAKIYSADPEVIRDAELIRHVTYAEALEMNYIGINIINDYDIFMLNEAGIPMMIASTDTPEDEGMLISTRLPENARRKVTACIAGHNSFSVIHVNKYGLNKTSDFAEKLFGVFRRNNIACQHYLSGIHKMAIVLKSPIFDLRRDKILTEMKNAVNPDSLDVERGLSLIAIVGEGMSTVKGVFSRIFDALARVGIKVKMIEQGADDLNIIVGVSDSDYEPAIRTLYRSICMNDEEWD